MANELYQILAQLRTLISLTVSSFYTFYFIINTEAIKNQLYFSQQGCYLGDKEDDI